MTIPNLYGVATSRAMRSIVSRGIAALCADVFFRSIADNTALATSPPSILHTCGLWWYVSLQFALRSSGSSAAKRSFVSMSPSLATTFAPAAFSSRAFAVFDASLSGVDVHHTIFAAGCFSRMSRSAASNRFSQSAVGVSSE